MNAFIWCHVPSKTAWATTERYAEPRPSGLAFCFELPLDWVPQDQAQFEKAMQYKGYRCAHNYEWKGLYEES